MAVYTEVTEQEAASCLKEYEIGQLTGLKGIAQGVENSNFLLETTQGKYILTLFEKRIKPEELPWYLGLMQYLARHGISCPLPIKTRQDRYLMILKERQAVIVTFLEGEEARELLPDHCFALGHAMAQLHQVGQGYSEYRKNNVGPDCWPELLKKSTGHGHDPLVYEILPVLRSVIEKWPDGQMGLPMGQIHADLFPDNVFFQQNRLSGFIDFYFACTDFLAYDLAVTFNAWCFTETGQYIPERADALLAGYESVRPLTEQENRFLPVFKMGAALRFLLTRLYDWIHTPSTALVTPKDPYPYLYRLKYYQQVYDWQ